MVDLKELIKGGEKLAKKQLLVHQVSELIPMFHLVSPDGDNDVIVGCPWRNSDEKQIIVSQVKDKSHEMGAIAVMFIAEAWMASIPEGTNLAYVDPPSQQPNRIEVVMLAALDNKGNKEVSQLKIIRDRPGGEITALEKLKSDVGEYQLNLLEGLLP